MAELPFISIVIPVKNGAGRLETCLESLSRLRYPTDRFEIIVADGRSTDATRAIALAGGAKVVDNPRELVASGRNAGFAASKGEIVAFTDDDCTFPADWLERAAEHFRDASISGLGGPTLVPTDESPFGRAVALLFQIGVTVARSVHAEKIEGRRDATDLPGCNMFYRREALEQVMPIVETLVTGEDVELGFRLRELGLRLYAVPDVAVWHHKRPTPRRFFRQMRRFAIGRLQVGRRRRGALRTAHVAAGLALPVALLLLPLTIALALPSALIIAAAALWRTRSLSVALWAPVVLAGGLAAWSAGFLGEWLRPTPVDEAGFDWSRHAG